MPANDTVPHKRLRASTIWKFLSLLLQGLSQAMASKTIPALAQHPSRVRRLWKRFKMRAADIRTRLYERHKPPDQGGASHAIQTIAHMACVFKASACPVTAYVQTFGCTFP